MGKRVLVEGQVNRRTIPKSVTFTFKRHMLKGSDSDMHTARKRPDETQRADTCFIIAVHSRMNTHVKEEEHNWFTCSQADVMSPRKQS